MGGAQFYRHQILDYGLVMFATVSLRFREQDLITLVMGKFLDSGWSYQGFIPGPEYTAKSHSSTVAIGNQGFHFVGEEKDIWFLLSFLSPTATEIPAGLDEIQISGKKDAFFKANQPVFLSGRIATFPKRKNPREKDLGECTGGRNCHCVSCTRATEGGFY